jgi:hypothetical protein
MAGAVRRVDNRFQSRFWPWSLLWAALFALAHTQSPEYFSNQHHYYLHGFAQAGVGHLNEDWLSNTEDPTPVFSWGVAHVYRWFGPVAFQVIYFALLCLYFVSVRQIVIALPGMPDRGPAHILFLTLFLAVHAAILRVASVRLTGVDYPWYLQAGLAAQYLLGPGLQPSAFGVLLVASIAAFMHQRPIFAASLAAATAVIHSTYLLPAGLLVLAYMIVLVRERKTLLSLVAGLFALVIVSPVLAYNASTFLAGDSVQLREAQRIFARVRIPHHTLAERWFDWMAAVQLGIMLLGLLLVVRTRLFLVLAIPTAISAVLSIVQVATDSDALSLIFPWRFSVVLMPLSVAVILARLSLLVGVSRPASALPLERKFGDFHYTNFICCLIAVGLAAAGVVVMARGLGYYTNDAELQLLKHIREHKKPGEVYLLPVRFPKPKRDLPTGQSMTFAPTARVGVVGIPVDLQRFRLSTEAAIYIDFKAPPYAPDEVLEWHQRMTNAERWYSDRDWDRTGVWREVRAAGITHVIATTDKDLTCRALRLVYSDESYRLYRVEGD